MMSWREEAWDATREELAEALSRLSGFPGISSADRRQLFADELAASLRHIGAPRAVAREPLPRDWDDLRGLAWEAWRAIVGCSRAGDNEEATWLAVVVTHLARLDDTPDPWASVRAVYSGFGEEPLAWNRVICEPGLIRSTCLKHAEECGQLRFGNHRKFESPRPDHRGGIPAVLESYVEGIRRLADGSQVELFGTRSGSPTRDFDRLMGELQFIRRFGRTARFDLLTLFGNLGVYELEPGDIYLTGATGPLRGAMAMFGIVPRTRADLAVLGAGARRLAQELGVPLQAVEDALCNWQKHAEVEM